MRNQPESREIITKQTDHPHTQPRTVTMDRSKGRSVFIYNAKGIMSSLGAWLILGVSLTRIFTTCWKFY